VFLPGAKRLSAGRRALPAFPHPFCAKTGRFCLFTARIYRVRAGAVAL